MRGVEWLDTWWLWFIEGAWVFMNWHWGEESCSTSLKLMVIEILVLCLGKGGKLDWCHKRWMIRYNLLLVYCKARVLNSSIPIKIDFYTVDYELSDCSISRTFSELNQSDVGQYSPSMAKAEITSALVFVKLWNWPSWSTSVASVTMIDTS